MVNFFKNFKIFKNDKIFTFSKIFIKGIFLGIADMIPAISGATFALIFGIYYRLILAIKNIQVKKILKLKFKEFLTEDFKFLINLFLGIFFSFIFFSKILNFLILDLFYRSFLMSFFLGLSLSLLFSLIKEIEFNFFCLIYLFLGIFLFLGFDFFSRFNLLSNSTFNVDISYLFYIKIFILGFIAILATLLPGISGSYVLTIFGVYPFILNALANLFDFENFKILFSLGLGVLLGLKIFPKFIHFLLKNFYFYLLSFITGIILASLKIFWPFYTYKKMVFQKKDLLIPLKMNFSFDFSSTNFYLCFFLIILGFFVFNFLKRYQNDNFIKQKNIKKNSKKVIKKII